MIYAFNSSRAAETTMAETVAETSSAKTTASTTVVTSSSKATTTVTTTKATTTETATKATTTAATATASTTAATTSATQSYTGATVDHVVKSGDNFYSILREHGIEDTPANVAKMCSINGLSESSVLYLGEVIKVPTE